jgi:hypothetical protein
MLATNAHVSAFLTEQIYYSLDNNLLLNALFLATRLRAHNLTLLRRPIWSLCAIYA